MANNIFTTPRQVHGPLRTLLVTDKRLLGMLLGHHTRAEREPHERMRKLSNQLVYSWDGTTDPGWIVEGEGGGGVIQWLIEVTLVVSACSAVAGTPTVED